MPGQPLTAAANSVYEKTRGSLLQVRTLLDSAGQQSSIGSGFLVSADGLVITNYHVVSQYALQPSTYRMEYLRTDGASGKLTLIAFDVINDLALVRLEDAGADALPFLEFDRQAVDGGLHRGDRLFSLGNPRDVGFTIVEGTYNGLVEKSYTPRIHFTGAINAGMSGGPAVTGEARIAGVNVSKRYGDDLMSFLVPADRAAHLLERARGDSPMDTGQVRREIASQVLQWQDGFYQTLDDNGFHERAFGPYRALESSAPWFQCWARTNADAKPKPRAQADRTECSNRGDIFVSDDIYGGGVTIGYTYLRNLELNTFQFSNFMARGFNPGRDGRGGRSSYTRPVCQENFVQGSLPNSPVVRAVWCARAWRDFEGIYNVTMTAITQDDNNESLLAEMSMTGVSHENAILMAQRFMEGLTTWRP